MGNKFDVKKNRFALFRFQRLPHCINEPDNKMLS